MTLTIHAIEDIVCLNDDVKKTLRQFGDFVMHETMSDADIVNMCHDADIIITKKKKISADVVRALPHLKYIVTLSAGHEHLPKREIDYLPISNAPTHNSQAVAEHAWAMTLALMRRVCEADKSICNGLRRHSAYDYEGYELHGKTLGLVGYGRIGQRIAMIAQGFAMTTLVCRSSTPQMERDHMYRTADLIILCAPHNKHTHHIINADVLTMMKESAFLVNVGRGGLVDTEALYEMLMTGQIRGAALDVIEGEPYEGAITPLIDKVTALPNVVMTPHIGYNTRDANDRLGQELIDMINAYLTGEPINIVNHYDPSLRCLHTADVTHELHTIETP